MRFVRYALGIIVSMLLFRILNGFNLPSCKDCTVTIGLPFRYYEQTGAAAGHWLPGGVFGDLACILGVGIGLGWLWGRLRNSPIRTQ
jgi:hypothetical protein